MDKTVQRELKRQQRSILDVLDIQQAEIKQNRRQVTPADRHLLNKGDTITKDIETNMSTPKIFLFSVHTGKDSYFLLSTFEEIHHWSATELPENTNNYRTEYEKIQTISHTIKYVGFCILSVMVVEVS